MTLEAQPTTRRGILKIYLGAAPGVGKTCAMLTEAHELLRRGRDVVVGVVEDHGREYTKYLTFGLDVLPRREGIGLGELDVDAVIRRRPEIVLVDEFAHSNGANSPHMKRWEDVNEILDAGIDVISTVNIQHVESLNDVVSQITGIVQRETIPDAVVRAAETIELVDLSPEFLRTRLSDGLIYRPDRIGPALGGYFRIGNLTALRELALLWLADQVEEALETYREQQSITETWETRERVVVAVADAQTAEPLIRRGRRVASKSSAELIVVHVVTGEAFVTSTTSSLPRLTSLSQGMGAKLHQIAGDNVPDALLHFAKSVNATQLVLGKSEQGTVSRFFEGSVTEQILRRSGTIDCHIVNLADPPRRRVPGMLRMPRLDAPRHRFVSEWLSAIALPLLTTVLLVHTHAEWLATGTVGAFYFAVILVASLIAGIWPALLTALLSAMALNWFFTPPLRTFDIADPANLVVLFVMVATALAVAMLVQRARVERTKAAHASRQADLLTILSQTALQSSSPGALVEKAREVFGLEAITVYDSTGTAIAQAWNNSAGLVQQSAVQLDQLSSTHIDSLDGSITLVVRMSHQLGADRKILAVVADHLANLYQRQQLMAEASRVEAIAAADDLRRALLSSVSHDLRTPLATAKLSASSLGNTEVNFTPQERAELQEGLEESIDQLNNLVDNLLDSSRLAAGVVSPQEVSVDVEETIHRAVSSCAFGKPQGMLQRVIVGRSVAGARCLGDPPLLERALANIIDNALRYSQQSDVVIEASHSSHGLAISITDQGPGIPERFRPQLFQPFQRLGDSENDNGVGLGMSVAKGFVAAMHGEIDVVSGHNAGTTFVVTMPTQGLEDRRGEEK